MVDHRHRLIISLTGSLFLILLSLEIIFAASSAQAAREPQAAATQQVAGGQQAVLFAPSIDKFPVITTYLDVRDKDGAFVSGLQAGQVSILEDDQALQVDALHEIKPGAQFVLALNPGRSFVIRDGSGRTRLESLQQAIQGWINSQSSPATDDLSLIISNGPEVIHNSDPKQLASALQAYQPQNVPDNPDLNVLSSAVETVADNPPRQGMGKAVLFVTSLPSIDLTVGLKSLAGSASQQGVRISIWLVGSQDQADTPAAIQLQALATQTHGQYLFYSGSETLPDIGNILAPVQNSYSLTYHSKIHTSVPHRLSAQVDLGGSKITTAVQTFELNIQAPNPMFVSPPTQIQREIPSNSQNPTNELQPLQQPLDIVIEFPDGYSRSVMTSTLFVDGTPVAANLAAPFDKFNWDLSSYTSDSDHLIRVEVVDALGLRGTSREIPVHITILRNTQGVMATLYRNSPLLAILAAILAGAILLFVLLLGGWIKPMAFGRSIQPGAKVRPAEKTIPHRRVDPVTQPVLEALGDPLIRHKPAWMNRLPWPQRRISPKAFAYLTRLSEADQEQDSTPIPIDSDEVTLGSEPIRVSLVIDDPSVEPFHASMRREGLTYRLSDQGSIAGTWVNYAPVSSEGILLEHADILHIGRAGFRFTLREPGKLRTPVVRSEAPKP